MISPQSIAIGAAAVGLVGKESELFRFTLKHSFIMLFAISIITCIQAYVTPWVIPVYEKITEATTASISDVDTGINYLLILGGILSILFVSIKYFGPKSNSRA
jgi:lactate permease